MSANWGGFKKFIPPEQIRRWMPLNVTIYRGDFGDLRMVNFSNLNKPKKGKK